MRYDYENFEYKIFSKQELIAILASDNIKTTEYRFFKTLLHNAKFDKNGNTEVKFEKKKITKEEINEQFNKELRDMLIYESMLKRDRWEEVMKYVRMSIRLSKKYESPIFLNKDEKGYFLSVTKLDGNIAVASSESYKVEDLLLALEFNGVDFYDKTK